MCTVEFFRSSFGIGAYVTLVVIASILTIIMFPLEGGMPETRLYYISADQVIWDYLGEKGAEVETMPLSTSAAFYFKPSAQTIGNRYIKARYRRYTSKAFDEVAPDDPSQGILGPTIYARVGDTIKIHFRNNLPYPTNIYLHGLERVGKSGPFGPFDERLVEPGGFQVYTWQVTEEAGPQGIYDGAVAWLYHPDLTAEANWHSGLVGMLVVTTLNAESRPVDIHSSYPLFMAIFDENLSPFLDISGEEQLGVGWTDAVKNSSDFRESNRKATINGLAVQQLPNLLMEKGKTTQLYAGTMSTGTVEERVTLHLHGHSFYLRGHRRTAHKLTPGASDVIEVFSNDPGDWLIRTTNAGLNDRGMEALYTVTSP
jgi:FtsP/CotA-like multicopper oxidase with cupredoxin domain